MTRMVDTLTNIALIPEPVPAGAPALRVALVGCGKTKLAHPARARDLYTGNLFVAKNPLWGQPHETHAPPGLFSRALNGSPDLIAVWPGSRQM